MRLTVNQDVAGSIPASGAMDIYQYFQEEYEALSNNINVGFDVVVETKNVVQAFAALEKDILYLIISFKFDTKNIDKLLQTVEDLASNSRKLLKNTENLQHVVKKTMSF